VVAVVACALLLSACGGGAGGGASEGDPVAVEEDAAAILANSQYPELADRAPLARWSLDTGSGLTQVLSYVPGLSLDEIPAAAALAHFERWRADVDLEVVGEGRALPFRVRPRNSPRRYVIVVPDGAPLPAWAGRPVPGRSVTATRPVNIDQVVTLVRVAEEPFALWPPFADQPRAVQLDAVFIYSACVRSTRINTDNDLAYTYGAGIHNQGEGVICRAEARQLAARQLGLAAGEMATVADADRVVTPSQGGPSLAGPPFDAGHYERLPRFGPIFSLG
jgi:hypothetical protein